MEEGSLCLTHPPGPRPSKSEPASMRRNMMRTFQTKSSCPNPTLRSVCKRSNFKAGFQNSSGQKKGKMPLGCRKGAIFLGQVTKEQTRRQPLLRKQYTSGLSIVFNNKVYETKLPQPPLSGPSCCRKLLNPTSPDQVSKT